MSVPVQLASVLLVLIVSASAHVTVIGQPVPVLWLIAAAVVLALAASCCCSSARSCVTVRSCTCGQGW
jgi:hypothetical protein